MDISFNYGESAHNAQSFEEVALDIPGDPEDIPGLKDLLVAAAGEAREIEVHLRHDFRFPRDGGSILDETLKQGFQSSHSGCLQVTAFRGQLSGSAMAALPSSLLELYLAVKDGGHYGALTPHLPSLPTRLPRLTRLGCEDRDARGGRGSRPALSFASA